MHGHRPAAQIIDGVHFRELLTDIESPLESRQRFLASAETRFRILLAQNHALRVQRVGQIHAQGGVAAGGLRLLEFNRLLSSLVTLRPDLRSASAQSPTRQRMLPWSRWADAFGCMISSAR